MHPTEYLQSDHWKASRGAVPFRWESWTFFHQDVPFPASEQHSPVVVWACTRNGRPVRVRAMFPHYSVDVYGQ
jgi:hypothetical protein